MNLLYTFLLSFFLFSASCSSKKEQNQPIETTKASDEDSILLTEVNAMPDAKLPQLRHYSQADVAKFTIATIMGQSPRIMSVSNSEGLYIVSYIRPSDSQRFTYKVKLEGHLAIWATIDGRWRDMAEDERITYCEVGKKLKITQTFSDGSSDEKVFSK